MSFTSEQASAGGKAGAAARWEGHVKVEHPPEEPCSIEDAIFCACHLLHAKKLAHRKWASEVIKISMEQILARNDALLRVSAKLDSDDT
jgi:hypothetical protein